MTKDHWTYEFSKKAEKFNRQAKSKSSQAALILFQKALQRHYSVDLSITDSLIALYAISDFPLLTTLGSAFHQILLSSDLQEVRRLTQSLVC